MQEAKTPSLSRILKCLFAAFAIGFALRVIYFFLALPLLGLEWAMLFMEWQGIVANCILALVLYPWVAKRLR